ncbi:hypothetical protein CCAX7_004990 [Capsulimonas corticalis]|uniref:Uncharacterized protein n=1 Tax=Capsulimonas corticalis TaxID=2219043 RepID=A0A402D2V0_9BACT|nr:hypothetical protein CCAX7_004990 [Capsulimonas corticalis]
MDSSALCNTDRGEIEKSLKQTWGIFWGFRRWDANRNAPTLPIRENNLVSCHNNAEETGLSASAPDGSKRRLDATE